MSRFATFSQGRRAVVVFTVAAAIAMLAVSAPAIATAPSSAPTINTYVDWDGGSYIAGLSHPLGATFGQVITIPRNKTQVDRFTVYVDPLNGDGGIMKFRGDVYGWDGTKATNKVWESNRRTLDLATIGDEPEPVTFRPGAVVDPRKTYVLFLTISKDFERTAPNTGVYFAGMPTGIYDSGHVAQLDDQGHPARWTTWPWSPSEEWDIAMKVWMS